MRADLHLHPLSHKYYKRFHTDLSDVVLDEEDKRNIQAVVDWCCHERKLDMIALTDHDMIQASLYAQTYAAERSLPIKVVAGAECSVSDPHIRAGSKEIHLLCLGLDRLPHYNSGTTVEAMIHAVHDAHGFVIMAHPQEYPDSFFRYCALLDGYEYRNGIKEAFHRGKQYVDTRIFSIKAFSHSDFHYKGQFPPVDSPALHETQLNDDFAFATGK